MLSPLELENKRIITTKRKYDRFEMDEYLDLLFENYKALYNEYEEQKKQIKTLTDGIQYYRSIESTMQKALVLAEKTSKETKDAAILKAESIEKDAKSRAEKILTEAETEYNRIREQCVTLVQHFTKYKAQLQIAAKESLRLVNSTTFEVDTPEIEGETIPVEAAPVPGAETISPEENYSPMTEPVNAAAPIDPVSDVKATEEQPKSSVYSFSGDTRPLPNLGNVAGYPDESGEPVPEIPIPQAVTQPQMATQEQNMVPPVTPEVSATQVSQQQPSPQQQPVPSVPTNEPATGAKNISDQFQMLNEVPAATEPTVSTEPVPDKTMVIPDVSVADRNAMRTTKPPMSSAETMSILTAETINLGDSIRAVRGQEESLQVPEQQTQPQVLELDPSTENKATPPTGLDTILQNITIGKKKKQNGATEEDPFEFLGSVDDF
ncbi:MAG: DivIVA domain-containing protein [Eubacterium sp.]|nr:DivIVA domain-containing protein [Eubacterium sp.]